MSGTDAIVVEGLTKTFRRQTAVDRVSFRVARGRFFGFLGPNGAGKSTTIKMLTGLLRPTSGDAVIEGVRLSGDLLALKRKIGVLTEELPLYERLSGEEHLLFAARMHGLARPPLRFRRSLPGYHADLRTDERAARPYHSCLHTRPRVLALFGSEGVTGIAPRDPSTPPDMRFSASGA